MPIVKVVINDQESAYCLLDTASSNTFCTKELATKLGIKGECHELNLKTLSETASKKSEVVNLSVSSGNGARLNMSGVYVTDEILVKNTSIDVDQYEHLRDLGFSVTDDIQRVDLLTDQDYSDALIPLDIRRGRTGEPFAIKSMLGWCLKGSVPTSGVSHNVVTHFIVAESPTVQDVSRDNHRLREIDNEGLGTTSLSQSDKYVLNLWDQNHRKVDGHYELQIPWKNSEDLPNDIAVAKARLSSLLKKLQREGLEERYNVEFQKLIDKGYVEKVPDDEIDSSPKRTWYLPHHHVIHPKKPNKLRIVYDCANVYQGKSLNDRVLQGPDLVNKLLHIILRFREHSYALQADMEAMYNQVVIPVHDVIRDALRLLWITDGKITHYRKTRHLFGGIWCASSPAYALRRTVIDNPDVHPSVQDTVFNSFYVDDCIRSFVDKSDVFTVIMGTADVLQFWWFQPHPACSKRLGNTLTNSARETAGVSDITSYMEGKILGLKWNISSHTLFFEMNEIPEHVVTKRKMCSILPSLYDPLGFIGVL